MTCMIPLHSNFIDGIEYRNESPLRRFFRKIRELKKGERSNNPTRESWEEERLLVSFPLVGVHSHSEAIFQERGHFLMQAQGLRR